MDTALHHFCNKDFIIALKELRDRNVLVLLFDGAAVFGRLGRIDDCVIDILPAVGVEGALFVRYRPPNATLPQVDILLSEALIDVCDIVAVFDGPFIIPPISKVTKPAMTVAPAPPTAKTMIPYREQFKLAAILAELEGQNLGVVLLGGWVVGGQMGGSDGCLALMGPCTAAAPLLLTVGSVNVFGPALFGGVLPLVGPFRAWLNQRAMSSILLP